MSLTTEELDLEECLAELDIKWRKLPVEALRYAQTHREIMIPELIRLIEEATEAAREGTVLDSNGQFFAFFLLTEFGAREAWPTLLAAMRLPDDLAYKLFGDVIHDLWPDTIQRLAHDRVADVLALIRDGEVEYYVRWTAIRGLAQMVAWESHPRDEVVDWMRTLFLEFVAAGDMPMCTAIICEVCKLWPGELMNDIRDAYARNLVDDDIINIQNIEDHYKAGLEAKMLKLVERRTTLTDTVAELSHWSAFQECEPTPPAPTIIPSPASRPQPSINAAPANPRAEEKVQTIYRETPRVGRNDPCPCGSGKKFKKCCG